MQTYKLSQAILDRDYHGCGKAWAATKDGEIVAIRYMGECDHTWSDTPKWLTAVRNAANGCDDRMLPTAHGSACLSAIAEAASACDDCPKPPRRERYRPTELLSMARATLTAVRGQQFEAYRAKCREELAALGEVKSGMCSCCTFVAE